MTTKKIAIVAAHSVAASALSAKIQDLQLEDEVETIIQEQVDEVFPIVNPYVLNALVVPLTGQELRRKRRSEERKFKKK